MKNTARFVLACATLALVTGCKTQTDQNNLVDHISLNNNQVTFQYVATFTDNIEADIEGEFLVGKYGTISFFNDSKNHFNMGITATFDVFSDVNLKQVTTLPNGANFPAIVTGPLYQLQVAQAGNYRVFAFLDKKGTIGQGVKLAGLALELNGIKNNFPQVSITQSFYNDANERIASFTLYGPRTVNNVTLPGGLFVIGDINSVVNSKSVVNVGEPNVHGPEASRYQSDAAGKALLKQAEKALQQHGIRLHFRP
jgi:hypothetical protein